MAVRVVVDNRVRVDLVSVPEEHRAAVEREMRERFEHPNPTHGKLKAMGYRFDHRKEPKTIATWGESPGWISLPRGGMGRVRDVLREHGLAWVVEDRRSTGDAQWGPGFRWPEWLRNPDGSPRELYPDQQMVVDACEAKHNCIVRSATGSGKTSSLLALAMRLKLPTLIVVWTGGLFDQWVERVQNELGLDPRWIGKVKGGVRTYGPVTIGMQQTIAKMRERGKLPDRHDDFFERWGLVGCDEVHRFAAKTFFDAVDPFTAKYRIGVSDDERRADRKDFMIGDLFGGVAAEVTKEELVGKGRILDVAMRIVPTGWRPTSKNAEAAEIVGEDDVDRSDTHALLAEMGGDDARNAIVVEHAARYVQEGHQVLVFTLRREHVLRLAQLLGSRGLVAGLLVGGADYQVEFRDALARLKSGEMRVAVGMVQAVGTGIDLPALARGVVGMPIAGNKSLLRQVSGRICRASSGKSAEIAYLYDEEVFPDHFGKLSKASVAPLVWCAESGTWVSPKEWRAGQRASRQLELA